ncbi:MAG: peroxiredoxin [Buchnera aphidicola (Eriosoma harunire)]
MTLINQQAPNFIAPAVLPNGEIIDTYNFKDHVHSGCILFFWPLDFTFVCPTEIIAFDQSYKEFKKRNIEIIGISIDSVFVHNQWRNTPIHKGGIGKIQFTMISDLKKEIQKLYDVEHRDLGVSLRATFIINQNKIIKHQSVNDLSIGRNIAELIRIVDAIQFNEKHGEVCPANWKQGDPGLEANELGIQNYLKQHIIHK